MKEGVCGEYQKEEHGCMRNMVVFYIYGGDMLQDMKPFKKSEEPMAILEERGDNQ